MGQTSTNTSPEGSKNPHSTSCIDHICCRHPTAERIYLLGKNNTSVAVTKERRKGRILNIIFCSWQRAFLAQRRMIVQPSSTLCAPERFNNSRTNTFQFRLHSDTSPQDIRAFLCSFQAQLAELKLILNRSRKRR
jgi:hypothetical protein